MSKKKLLEEIKELKKFLPSNQITFLKKITEKCKSDEEFIAVEMIIASIVVVENVFKGKGQEILKGAHVVFGDPELFNYLKNNAQTRDRISSHYKKTLIEQKGVDIPHHSEFLVGLAKDKNASAEKSFWMQMESNKVDCSNGLIRGAILLVMHMLDFLRYKWTGKNVGPCGLSEFTETKPIKINRKKFSKEILKERSEKTSPTIAA
jgi:hypothetical protein